LPVRRTLEKVGVPRATFYRWYDLYQAGGPEALDDRHPKPDRIWNRIPDDVRERIIKLALEESALSPRELAVRFTDTEGYFVSEASVYRLLNAHDLIASPAFIVMKAADEFKDKTTAPNQLWQTDFTYLKVVGWGWFYLSTVLDDFSRYIIAWKLCTTMKAEDVTATLEMALEAAALDKARVLHRPRLLSDNGSSYISGDLAKWLKRHDMGHVCGAPYHPMTQGKIERWHQTLKNRILLENYYLAEGHLPKKLGPRKRHRSKRRALCPGSTDVRHFSRPFRPATPFRLRADRPVFRPAWAAPGGRPCSPCCSACPEGDGACRWSTAATTGALGAIVGGDGARRSDSALSLSGDVDGAIL
jgi:transposase InsO family protein